MENECKKKNFCQQIIGTWEKFLANKFFAFLMEPGFILYACGCQNSQLYLVKASNADD